MTLIFICRTRIPILEDGDSRFLGSCPGLDQRKYVVKCFDFESRYLLLNDDEDVGYSSCKFYPSTIKDITSFTKKDTPMQIVYIEPCTYLNTKRHVTRERYLWVTRK